MNIAVYIEPLKTFTSGMPHRGMLFELIKLRGNDNFILVLRKGGIPDFLEDFLNRLKIFNNWSLVFEKDSSTKVNIKALLNYKNHCKINVSADVYINLDASYLGDNCKPQIVTVHDLSSVRKGDNSSISFTKRFARKFSVSNGILNADKIISISNFTKNDIIDYFDYSKSIEVVYNGIDDSFFQGSKINNDESSDYFLWYGNFSVRKNLKRLLISYECFLKSYENRDNLPSLVLVGKENEYFHELKSLVDGSNLLASKVVFKRQLQQDHLIQLVSQSKGLLFPSLYEGFGLPLIESYSQGVPVLSSNITSLPEVSGGKAVLVDPLSIDSLTAGLQKFWNSINEFNSKELIDWSLQFSYTNCALEYSKIIDRIHAENG